jgi:DNA-binding FadR family transcriptional regulator
MEKLTDLIEAGDVEGAGTHWRRHLENANKLWLDGQERSTLLDLLPV